MTLNVAYFFVKAIGYIR